MIAQDAARRIAEELRREIEDLLASIGLLFRVFGRGKSEQSLHRKITENPGKYSPDGRHIQDLIGIRVVLYFPEDIPVVQEILQSKYTFIPAASTIDRPDERIFSVTRHNLIFDVPESYAGQVHTATQGLPIDCTFEIQLRSILSEGWHEVDHDLRYKQPDNWTHHEDLSRNFNGIVATLETAEWSMRKILDELAYRNYKRKQWAAMLHCLFRMRVSAALSGDIAREFDNNPDLAKEMLRVDRKTIFLSLTKLAPRIPITMNNMVYLWNFLSMENERIILLTPDFLRETFEAASLGSV